MSSTKPRVLVVLTSASSYKKNGEDKPTGWYLPEFSHPYDVLKDDAELVVVSPKGGKAPLDPASVEASKEDKISVDFLQNNKALFEQTEKLETYLGRAKEFDALFYVGGVGPMWDLATDSDSHKLINEFHSANKVIAAVCHGPAALVNVKLADGSSFLNGKAVAGFSDAEEEVVGNTPPIPFSLEEKLKEASGGKYEKAEPWAEKVVVSGGGRLITGQNPGSAKGVGEKILAAIKA